MLLLFAGSIFFTLKIPPTKTYNKGSSQRVERSWYEVGHLYQGYDLVEILPAAKGGGFGGYPPWN